MSEFAVNLHPTLDRLHTIQEALFLDDLEGALNGGKVANGNLVGQFTPWDEADADYAVSQLALMDMRSGTTANIAFAPPPPHDNPMSCTEVDDKEFVARTVPVMARVLIQSSVGITVIKHPSIEPMRVGYLMFSFTESSSVLGFPDGADLLPVYGEFDGQEYRSIDSALCKYAPVDELAQFIATEL